MIILHVTECPSWGGGAAQVLALMGGLAARGHRVILATTRDSELLQRALDSRLEAISIETRSELNPAAVARLAWLSVTRGVNIIHAHASHAHTLGLLAAAVTGSRFVVSRRVSFRPRDNRGSRVKYTSPVVSRIVAVSEAVREVLEEYGVPPDRIEVIYSGSDPAVYHPGVDGRRVRDEFKIPPDARVVGKVANFYHRWKGHDTFLSAAATLAAERPGLRFLLAGRETDGPKMRGLVRELGLEDRIALAGFRRDVPEVLAAIDVSVNASRSGEGLSGAVRESLAMGRPVVATDVGGNRELVRHGETGLLVPADDPAALAASVARILDDDALARRLAEEGARHVRENLTVDRMVDATEDLYRRVLARS